MAGGKTLIRNGKRILRAGGSTRIGTGGTNENCCCDTPCDGVCSVCTGAVARVFKVALSGISAPSSEIYTFTDPDLPAGLNGDGVWYTWWRTTMSAASLDVTLCLPQNGCGAGGNGGSVVINERLDADRIGVGEHPQHETVTPFSVTAGIRNDAGTLKLRVVVYANAGAGYSYHSGSKTTDFGAVTVIVFDSEIAIAQCAGVFTLSNQIASAHGEPNVNLSNSGNSWAPVYYHPGGGSVTVTTKTDADNTCCPTTCPTGGCSDCLSVDASTSGGSLGTLGITDQEVNAIVAGFPEWNNSTGSIFGGVDGDFGVTIKCVKWGWESGGVWLAQIDDARTTPVFGQILFTAPLTGNPCPPASGWSLRLATDVGTSGNLAIAACGTTPTCSTCPDDGCPTCPDTFLVTRSSGGSWTVTRTTGCIWEYDDGTTFVHVECLVSVGLDPTPVNEWEVEILDSEDLQVRKPRGAATGCCPTGNYTTITTDTAGTGATVTVS